jgi:hypothetical protein
MSRLNCVLVSAPANLGYKFVAEGIITLLKSALENEQVDVAIVDKHARNGIVEHFEAAQRLIAKADLVILAGGPILWPFVDRSDWGPWLAPAIIRAAQEGKAIAGVALGSCYALQPEGTVQACRDEDLDFALPLLRSCSLLTVRDQLTQTILSRNGISSELLPCLGYLGTSRHNDASIGVPPTVLINHVRAGGPHDYLEIASEYAWASTTRRLISELKHSIDLRFLCHSVEEYELAPIVDSSVPAFLATNISEFAAVSRGATCALNNRIHASIGLAGLRVPSLTVGNDSRIFSLAPFGLPALGLPCVDYDRLLDALHGLLNCLSKTVADLDACLNRTTEAYANLFGTLLRSIGHSR